MSGSALQPDAVRAAMERVLSSRTFAGAGRSRDLLRYLVEALLAGRAGELKEYTVGAEGLGRGEKFDPRVDSIARAEASRLRNRLMLYYSTEGRDDPAVISLPTGGYVPAVAARAGETAPAAQPKPRAGRNGLIAAAEGLALLAAFGLGQLLASPAPSPTPAAAPVHADVALGAPGELWHAAGTSLSISRDGKMMVFLVLRPDGTTRLYSRRMDQLAATELPGTAGAFSPFLSPDGRWVAFVSGSELKKTLVDGRGSPVTISRALATFAGSWGEDGAILVTSDTDNAIWRVADTGGDMKKLVDLGPGGPRPRFPHLLPDGKGVIFTATEGGRTGSIDFVRLDGGGRKTLIPRGITPRYTPTGHIVYADGPQLFAQKFDIDRIETSGSPRLVLDNVSYLEAFAVSSFDIAADGTLIYSRARSGGLSKIVEIDERGGTTTLVEEPARRLFPRLSPDGRTLLYVQADGTDYDLMSLDMRTKAKTRLASGTSPAWSADGRWIFYATAEGLAARRSDGAGEPRLLMEKTTGNFWSAAPDGKTLGFQNQSPAQHLDIYTLPLDAQGEAPSVGEPKLFFSTRFTDSQPTFSPDGKWLSYVSNVAGEAELYVQPWPEGGAPVKVSPGRGRLAQWSRDGRHIFYETWDRRIMRVRYSTAGGRFAADAPEVWYAQPLADMSVLPNYALAPDGRSIVAFLPVESETRDHVTVLRNFFDTLTAAP